MTTPLPQHRIKLPNGGEIHVCSLWRAQLIYDQYDWVVSLLDPPATDPRFKAKDHTVFHIDDTEVHHPKMKYLSRGDIDRITSRTVAPGRKALIHCHAGISRSTAIAIMTAFRNGATLEAIRDGIDWELADPNTLILGWSGIICGQDLCGPVREWLSDTRLRSLGLHSWDDFSEGREYGS